MDKKRKEAIKRVLEQYDTDNSEMLKEALKEVSTPEDPVNSDIEELENDRKEKLERMYRRRGVVKPKIYKKK